MKHLFLLLFFTVGIVVSSVEYHGNRQYWTTVDSDGKTNIALHILEESVNLTFPKDKTFDQIVSDMKVYSPVGNEKCQDTEHTLGFTLMFDAQNHIRGEIKVDDDGIVMMYMYEQCGDKEKTDDYATEIIKDAKSKLEGRRRRCFKTRDPFHQYEKDATKNVMELERTRNEFGCQVFLILPKYMQVEDFPLPFYNTTTLNASFAGYDENFWWKSKNDSMLPDQVYFDTSENIFINILNSTKEKPYFFRIGSGQPIPVMNFTFGTNCKDSKFELYVNLKPKCFVRVELTDAGFKIATKTSVKNGFKGSLSSMVFGDKHVYIKVNSPLNIQSFKVCDDLSNVFDVPPDQFVLQVSPKKIANGCEKAEVVLLNSDVVNGIEVLIDRSKIMEIRQNITITENSTFFLTTSEVTKSAGLQWYWYLIIIIGILVVVIVAAIFIYVYCIRRRRQKTKKSKIPMKHVKDEEAGRKTVTTKTAASTEKVSKETKPSKTSDEKNVDKKKQKIAKKEGTKENDKLSKEKLAKIQSVQTPKPLTPTPIQPSEEKVVQPFAVQKPKPMPPLPIVPAKPLRNLKYRSMYGEDKRTKLDEPFDYHENESEEFKASIIPAEFPRPDLRIYDNFWDCLGQILKTTMFCRVFADNFCDKNTNVYFMFRDLVAESDLYAPLRSLSNRILEQCEDHSQKDVAPVFGKDGKKRVKYDWCYCLRVFVLSYDPLTVEIHCRGPWPHFVFNIFKCEKCRQLFKQLEKNEWKDSPVACDESWDQFICRVKRTAVNFHQFLTYYGGFGALEPENPNDVYNVFVFRGEWEQDNLRDCVHGCLIRDDKSHFNECELETSLQKSLSLSK